MGDARGMTYGLAAGAGLMFFLDPRQGGARRALIRDKSVRAAHEVEDAAFVGARDLSHRIEGAIARFIGKRHHEDVADDVLVARVRAKLGHVCAHPGAIEVIAKGNGCIELKGPIVAADANRVVAAIASVRGVREIDDDLERRAETGDEAALQGRAQPSPLVRLWTPATRLAAGGLAAAMAVSSLLRGRPLAFLLASASVLGIARSIEQRSAGLASWSRRSRQRPTPSAGGARGLREAYPMGSEWSPVVEADDGARDVTRATWPERR